MSHSQLSTIHSPLIKEGYKQTEVGVIPEDWDTAPAISVCQSVIDCKNRTAPVVNNDEFAVVRTPNVRNGKFVRKELRFTDAESFKIWTSRAIPQDDDILITREAPMGEVCLKPTDTKVCLGQRMMLYRPNPNKIISHYLLHILMSKSVQGNLASKVGGSTVGHAKVDDIKNVILPLPPTLAEQEAIAEALSDADSLIESIQQLIAKKRHIKQGAMQMLLSPWETENLQIENDSSAKNPQLKKGWVEKSVSDFGTITTGSTPSTVYKHYWNGNIPWITPTDINSSKIITTSERLISQAGLNSIRPLKAESVLVTCIASIGKNAILQSDGACNQQINAISPNLDYSSEFLYYLFEYNKNYLISKAGTTATAMISKKDFNDILFTVPPTLPEQTRIATILSDMDEEITTLETKLTKARQIKQGMMSELLTGKIRLV